MKVGQLIRFKDKPKINYSVVAVSSKEIQLLPLVGPPVYLDLSFPIPAYEVVC